MENAKNTCFFLFFHPEAPDGKFKKKLFFLPVLSVFLV